MTVGPIQDIATWYLEHVTAVSVDRNVPLFACHTAFYYLRNDPSSSVRTCYVRKPHSPSPLAVCVLFES